MGVGVENAFSAPAPRLRLPGAIGSRGIVQAGLPKYSGGTAADFNGLPFSPVMGTRARVESPRYTAVVRRSIADPRQTIRDDRLPQ